MHDLTEGRIATDVIAVDFLVYGKGASWEEVVVDHNHNLLA